MSNAHSVDNAYRRTAQVIALTIKEIPTPNSWEKLLQKSDEQVLAKKIQDWFMVVKNVTRCGKKKLQGLFHQDQTQSFLKLCWEDERQVQEFCQNKSLIQVKKEIRGAQSLAIKKITTYYLKNYSKIWENFERQHPALQHQLQACKAVIDPYLRQMRKQFLPQTRRNLKKQLENFQDTGSHSDSTYGVIENLPNISKEQFQYSQPIPQYLEAPNFLLPESPTITYQDYQGSTQYVSLQAELMIQEDDSGAIQPSFENFSLISSHEGFQLFLCSDFCESEHRHSSNGF